MEWTPSEMLKVRRKFTFQGTGKSLISLVRTGTRAYPGRGASRIRPLIEEPFPRGRIESPQTGFTLQQVRRGARPSRLAVRNGEEQTESVGPGGAWRGDAWFRLCFGEAIGAGLG